MKPGQKQNKNYNRIRRTKNDGKAGDRTTTTFTQQKSKLQK